MLGEPLLVSRNHPARETVNKLKPEFFSSSFFKDYKATLMEDSAIENVIKCCQIITCPRRLSLTIKEMYHLSQ